MACPSQQIQIFNWPLVRANNQLWLASEKPACNKKNLLQTNSPSTTKKTIELAKKKLKTNTKETTLFTNMTPLLVPYVVILGRLQWVIDISLHENQDAWLTILYYATA